MSTESSWEQQQKLENLKEEGSSSSQKNTSPETRTLKGDGTIDKDFDSEKAQSVAPTADTVVGKIKLTLQQIKEWLNNKRNSIYGWLNDKFGTLTFSQWCYFVAFIVLINNVNDSTTENSDYITVGIIAGLGLLRELWHVFARIWEHMLGKGVLLILYAATANFALAISALKINSISGIEPSIFVFTMGFTTLLMLPFWILFASVIFLGSAIVIGNLWLLLGLLLRIIGVRLKLHWEDQSFAFITMIFRFVLIPFLIYVLLHIMNPYLKQMDMFEVPLGLGMFDEVNASVINPTKFASLSEEELGQITQHIRASDAEPLPEALQQKLDELELSDFETGVIREMSDEDLANLINRLSQSPNDVTVINIEDTPESSSHSETSSDESDSSVTATVELDASEDEEEAEIKVLDNLIARFIYRFETYPYSSCAKETNQRVLQFDEDSMLVAERDGDAEHGISFHVAPCEPAYYQKKSKQTSTEEDSSETVAPD